MVKEEKAIILDYLPTGYPGRRHAEPIAQAIGFNFSLLELVPKEGITLKPEEEVYIGEGPRDKIRYIKGVLDYGNMTSYSKGLLPQIVEKLVRQQEFKFVEFFNKAKTITPRLHQLQLLPGLGKKHVIDFLDERKKGPFTSYQDILQRVRLFPDPIKCIVRRILQEYETEEKYYIFTSSRHKQYRS